MKETKFKMTEVGMIPQDWECVRLGDVAVNFTGLTYSPENVKSYGTLVLRSSNIKYGRLSFDDNVFVDMEIPQRATVQTNDLLVCVRNGSKALIGKSAVISKNAEGMAFGAFMTVLRATRIEQNFLNYCWNSAFIKQQISDNLGATINQITNADIDKFYITVPSSKVEQSRIASALSSIDNLLPSLDKLIVKKQAVKQGAMQQLLTGKTRLEGFKETWVEKKLGDINIKNGSMLNSSDYQQGTIPVIAGGQKPAGYHSESNRQGNTITISGSGANAGYVAFYDEPIFASDCSTINEQDNNIDIKFLYFLLLLKQSEIYKCQAGGAQPHIHAKDIKDISLNIPQEIPEQRAITRVLTSMDNELAALTAKKQKYEQIKQGMMQQLLTGKIRLI